MIKDLEQVAEHADARAQWGLGTMFAAGKELPKDEAAAAYWYATAAQRGFATAQFSLAEAYRHGAGVPQDYEKAVEWYTKAARQGHIPAQFFLSEMYLKGLGVPTNDTIAVEWLTKSAQQGFGFAQYSLAILYHHGVGVRKSDKLAYVWSSIACICVKNPPSLIAQAEALRRAHEPTLSWDDYHDAQRITGEWFKKRKQEQDRRKARQAATSAGPTARGCERTEERI